jgi:hypothetical protein
VHSGLCIVQAFSLAIDLSTLEPALIMVDEIEDHGQVCSRRAKCKGAIVSVDSIHFGRSWHGERSQYAREQTRKTR